MFANIKSHEFLGFQIIEGESKPIYFDFYTKKYKTMKTLFRIMKNKQTKEEIKIFNGMYWEFLEDELIDDKFKTNN